MPNIFYQSGSIEINIIAIIVSEKLFLTAGIFPKNNSQNKKDYPNNPPTTL